MSDETQRPIKYHIDGDEIVFDECFSLGNGDALVINRTIEGEVTGVYIVKKSPRS